MSQPTSTCSTEGRRRRWRVGLTGGIGSGKSHVARLFAALGVDIIDADEVARELTTPDSPLTGEIARLFGADVLDAAGVLRRDMLRARVFANPGERKQLEALLHPAIRARMTAAAERPGSPYCVLVVPLLVETREPPAVDRVLVVDAPELTQIHRVMARDHVNLEQAQQTLAAQAPRATRLACADDVLHNDEAIDLTPAVRALHARYLAAARHGNAPS